MSEQGYKVLLEKAAKVRKWGDNQTYRERFRKVISKSVSPEKLFSSLPETYSDSAEVHRATITNFMFPPERPAISKHDRLQAAYCLLTILHDKIYEYDSWVTPISVDIWSLDAEWIEALWEQMKKSSKAVASGDAEFFDKIDFALKLVEANLSKTPAEIEPQAEDMIIATIKKISKIIEKLETLKTDKKKYSKASLRFRWHQDDLRNSLWAQIVQPLVDEIEINLVELWDCILENTEWNKSGIENAIRTRMHDEIYRLDRLVHELEKIKHKMEIEVKQLSPEKPAGTEGDTTPAKGDREKAKTIGSIKIQNFQGILGDVQAENVQTGNHASIHKEVKAEKKNKGSVKKALKVIGAIIGFLAALLTCIYLSWWLWTKFSA